MEPDDILLDRYQLAEPIGQGGMSVVWRARDLTLRRDVAVKVLGASAELPPAPDCIRSEALAVASLTHPHVASVYDYGQCERPGEPPVPFVVMELLEGPTLAALTADGPMVPAEAMLACAQIAGALAAAHAHGIVHRDVKPANVIITATGAKVFDFGIAARVGTFDSPDEVLGTPTYLAPERVMGAPVSPASDVYSLGILLYRLLAGDHPWPARSHTELLMAHVRTQPPALTVPDVPDSVRTLYRRCLAKNPDERPSADEAARVLGPAAAAAAEPGEVHRPFPLAPAEAGTSTLPIVASRPIVASVRTAPRRRRRLAVPVAVATVLFGLLAVRASAFDISASPTGTGELGLPVPSPSEAAPAGPAPAEAATNVPAAARAADGSKTFESAGGTVVAACRGGAAYLLSWVPARGFKAKHVERGPAETASVTFEQRGTKVQVAATCPASGLVIGVDKAQDAPKPADSEPSEPSEPAGPAGPAGPGPSEPTPSEPAGPTPPGPEGPAESGGPGPG